MRWQIILITILSALGWSASLEAAEPIHGVLQDISQVTPRSLATFKSQGSSAVVVPLDESTNRTRWAEMSRQVSEAGLQLYAWIEVGRNERMASTHADWMATPGGHHDDWRRLFPNAPVAKPGELIKTWPWVPIGYAPAFEAHRTRVQELLKDLPGPWAGVFLNDLQAAPSSCGCGNGQCRWALDYGSPSTAAKTQGQDVAARFVAELQRHLPEKAVIPVWVTECEQIDLPRVAGSTGLCGTVECAKNTCWVSYKAAWDPLVEATSGPVAVALWRDAFDRKADWNATALALFQAPPRGGKPVSKERVMAIVQGWDRPEAEALAMARKLDQAQGGWVVALSKIDQSWQPRVIKWPR